jgi:diacylglycerol kinase (ATP)
MKRSIRFILNPKAGAGLNNSISELIKRAFDKSDYETEIIFTQCAGHATVLSKEAVIKKINIVAVAGGDGTINEATQSLKHSDTILAILPTGSGNGFARHFKIPLNIEKAIAVIKNEKVVRVDSLLINGRFCMNISGAGFDAHIANLFAGYGRRGFSSYIKLVIREYFSYKERKYTIEFDGQNKPVSAFLIAIANASQFGNGARISPLANADDGIIDLTILRKIPFYEIVFILAKIFNGKLVNCVYAEIIKSKTFHIRSSEEMSIHIDGEPAGTCKEIVAMVDPLSVKLMIP